MPTESVPVGTGEMSHCVFLFAHPDDEFACFESIRREIAGGHCATCVYLTDGGYNGQPTTPRALESRAVLGKLGVRDEDIHFIGMERSIPDGNLPENMASAYNGLLEFLDSYPPPGRIYVPSWEGGHQDHDATHLIGLALREVRASHATVWQFSLYNGKNLRGPFFQVMSPLSENGAVRYLRLTLSKRVGYARLCLGYPSQRKTWLGLFPFVAFKLICLGQYALQESSLERVRSRPHPGDLLYERRGALSWEQFQALADAFLSVSIREAHILLDAKLKPVEH